VPLSANSRDYCEALWGEGLREVIRRRDAELEMRRQGLINRSDIYARVGFWNYIEPSLDCIAEIGKCRADCLLKAYSHDEQRLSQPVIDEILLEVAANMEAEATTTISHLGSEHELSHVRIGTTQVEGLELLKQLTAKLIEIQQETREKLARTLKIRMYEEQGSAVAQDSLPQQKGLAIVQCKYCGGDIAVRGKRSPLPEYHKNCAWYDLPCDICGKAIRIHRDWEHPPTAHKECKDAQRAQYYEKPCEYCGKPLSVRVGAVKVPKFHYACAKTLRQAGRGTGAERERLRVFLCHSSSNKPKILELCERLRASGAAPWLDEEQLLPGHDWQHEISRAVRNSHVVIVCLSCTATNKTGYIQKEIKYALDIADEQPEGAIFLIPLKLEECATPDRLQRWQWVKLFADGGYQRLIMALRERARILGLETIEVPS